MRFCIYSRSKPLDSSSTERPLLFIQCIPKSCSQVVVMYAWGLANLIVLRVGSSCGYRWECNCWHCPADRHFSSVRCYLWQTFSSSWRVENSSRFAQLLANQGPEGPPIVPLLAIWSLFWPVVCRDLVRTQIQLWHMSIVLLRVH